MAVRYIFKGLFAANLSVRRLLRHVSLYDNEVNGTHGMTCKVLDRRFKAILGAGRAGVIFASSRISSGRSMPSGCASGSLTNCLVYTLATSRAG